MKGRTTFLLLVAVALCLVLPFCVGKRTAKDWSKVCSGGDREILQGGTKQRGGGAIFQPRQRVGSLGCFVSVSNAF